MGSIFRKFMISGLDYFSNLNIYFLIPVFQNFFQSLQQKDIFVGSADGAFIGF